MVLLILLLVLLEYASGNKELNRCPYNFMCHNGVCDSNGRCVCKPGWIGERCELESCPLRPCVNGYCSRSEDGRKFCQCDHRFEGQYCELDKDECALRPCPADAVCINHLPKHKKDKGYSCLCPIGFAGDFCEVEVDLCDIYKKKGENYCYNGGICTARYVCICEDGFGGSRCSHRVPYFREYKKFGCPERPEVCAKVFDNGHCDEVCNRESCLFDGFDCVKRDNLVCRHPSECAYKYGDRNCDEKCAGAECGFDGGDCDGAKSTSYKRDVNIIGVALGLPPEVAIKKLRQLQAELAQRLYTHVGLAEDVDGVMVYEWSSDRGQGKRVAVGKEQIVASTIQATSNGTIIFFDVDTSGCRFETRRNNSRPHCFTDLRAAATYLTLELAQSQPMVGKALPIRDVTWKKRQLEVFRSMDFPVFLTLICLVILVIVVASCAGIIVAIVRSRKRRQKTIFAPCWKVPGPPGCFYHPPTPPYSLSPDNKRNGRNSDSTAATNSLVPVVDAESPLLSAVRCGDLEAVKQMISSKETFVDAVDDNGLGPLHHAVANNDVEMLKLLISCGELDLFERNAAGQSPLLFAARMAHPGLECVSILVSSINSFRKRRHDDIVSDYFSDIGRSRKDLLRMLPLRDEADVKYALTDLMGRNVMHYAALYNAPHLVNYFATCGANVNLIDNNGDAPIHLAAKGGNVEALVALLINNCDVSIKDGFDRTAHAIADAQGHSVVCDVFHLTRRTSGT